MEKITCYNCNGQGEKTRYRGNHASLHRTTKCYTCNGSGELELTNESLKETIVSYLKNTNRSHVKTDICALWGETKSWCTQKLYEMGGSYASWGKEISVIINIKKEQFRFNISFSDLD